MFPGGKCCQNGRNALLSTCRDMHYLDIGISDQALIVPVSPGYSDYVRIMKSRLFVRPCYS